MAIDFDWNVLAESIENAQRMLSGHFLQKAGEEREQKRWMTRQQVEAAQHKLERVRAQEFTREMADKQKVISIELAEETERTRRAGIEWEQIRDARTKAILGDPDMERQFAEAMQSGNVMGQMAFQAQMNLINKLRAGATQDDFTEEELAGLQTLPPVASAGASDLILRNTKFKQDLELDAARMTTLQAQADYFTAMGKVQTGKETSMGDFGKLMKERAALQNELNKILGKPEFAQMSREVEEGGELDMPSMRWYEKEKERIFTLTKALQIKDAEINTILPGFLNPPPRQEAPPEPKKEPAKWKKAARKAAKKTTEQILVGGVTEPVEYGRAVTESLMQRSIIKKALKKAGLPAKHPVYTNIASLRKAGKLKVGMIVYHKRKVYRIISGKGKKWDLEEL